MISLQKERYACSSEDRGEGWNNVGIFLFTRLGALSKGILSPLHAHHQVHIWDTVRAQHRFAEQVIRLLCSEQTSLGPGQTHRAVYQPRVQGLAGSILLYGLFWTWQPKWFF